MWKCPNCETVNNTKICVVCGEKEPIGNNQNYRKEVQHQVIETVNYVQSENKRKPLYLIPVLLIVLAVIGGLILYYNLQHQTNDVDYIVNEVDEIYNETFPEDDNFILRENNDTDNDTDKQNIINETAVLNGSAASSPSESGVYNNIQLTNVEEYIENTIRPIYYSITSNNNLVSESKTNDISFYYDDSIKSSNFGISWIRYAAGAYGNQYERRYYFDSRNGELIFAFVFLGEEEYRLYFYKNSIIRYIDDHGVSIDNPTDSKILNEAEQAVNEAYIYKE